MYKSFFTSLLGSTALLALVSGANATGSHANPDYPPAAAFQRAGENANIGGFGRLFAVRAPNRPEGLIAHPSPRYDLVRLGQRMTAPGEAQERPSEMPLAYVFLGQFIDHDITFDTVTSFDEIATNLVIENARTADLDLDCVYGGGPERTPYLYDGPYLRIGAITVFGDEARRRHDLLRASPPGRATAVIGDPRNDENFVVSQMQAAFIAYHNRMVDRILEEEAKKARELLARVEGRRSQAGRPGLESAMAQRPQSPSGDLAQLVASRATGAMQESAQPESAGRISRALVLEVAEENGRILEILEQARHLTVHHYHRVISEDFIPRLIGIARTRDILENGRDYYFPNGFRNADGVTVEPFIPIEFAAAAYRYGHSQVPELMRLRGAGRDAVIAELFGVDKSGQSATFLKPNGFTPVRTDFGSLALDWNLFAPIHGPPSLVQRARRLDTILSDPLTKLERVGIIGPGGLGNLASRNLTRGRTYMLPSGQDLARRILQRLEQRGVLQDVYPSGGTTAEDFVLPADPTTENTLGIGTTPLFYYILQEADRFGAAHDANRPRTESTTGAEASLVTLPEAVGLMPERTQAEKESGGTATGGATLGPVGGTLVGEVLLGLLDYHREAEGSGLDLNTPWQYQILAEGAQPVAEGDLPAMTETSVGSDGVSGLRYQLRNFLHDAGVSLPPEPIDVCPGPATQFTEGC